MQTVVTHAPDEELLHPALTVRRHDHRGGFQHLRVVTNDLTHAPVVGIAAGHVDDELDAGFLKYRLEAFGDESARVGSVRGVTPALVRLDLLPERGARCGHGRVVGLRTMCTGKRSVSR